MTGREWTRRAFIASVVLPFPSERLRYADPATEHPVMRLTSPKHSSLLAPPTQRVVSRKGTFLIYASDQSGSPQLMQMFLYTGQARQLTQAASLDPSSPALSADDRSVFFFDGAVLKRIALATMRESEIYRVPEGWSRGQGFSLSIDGSKACLVETQDARWRLRVAPLGVTALDAAAPMRDPLSRPGHEDILFRDADGFLALADGGGRNSRRLPLAPGRYGSAFWSADGESLVYLNFPAASGQLNAIREWVAAGDAERLVSGTSQYATFAPNSDSSVFVGASADKASPYILLLLRITRRELTLCEHRASDAAAVSPFFSPDSQRVFFQSDRDGKPAIYMVDVRRLVERTES